MYDPLAFQKIHLDKNCVAVQRILSTTFMRANNLQWRQELDCITQNMLLELRYYFAKQDTITTIQRPRTWWDAFKYAYQGRWWLRWATPAQMEDIIVTHTRNCPHLDCSGLEPHLMFLVPSFSETRPEA